MPTPSIRSRKRQLRDHRTRQALHALSVDPFADPSHDHSLDGAAGAYADAHPEDFAVEYDDELSNPRPTGRAAVPLGKIGSNVSVPTRTGAERATWTRPSPVPGGDGRVSRLEPRDGRASAGADRDGSTRGTWPRASRDDASSGTSPRALRDGSPSRTPARDGARRVPNPAGPGAIAACPSCGKFELLPSSKHGSIELRIADITVEQLAQVVRESIAEGEVTWENLPRPRDIDAERLIVAGAAWGWLSDQAMRDLPVAAFFSYANRQYYAAIKAVRRSPTYKAVVVPDATAEEWAHCGGVLGEEAPLWPSLLVDVVQTCRKAGVRGPVASELLRMLQENSWHDVPRIDAACERVRDLWERRKLMHLFALASARIASEAVSPERVRARVVQRLGGMLP